MPIDKKLKTRVNPYDIRRNLSEEITEQENLITIDINECEESLIMAQPIQHTIQFQAEYLRSIPEFNGNTARLSEFIRSGDLIHNTFGNIENEFLRKYLLSATINKLTGHAAVVTSGREIETWNELKEILIRSFADQRDENSLLRDLMLLKQNNENATNFYQRCQNLRSLLFANLKIVSNDANIRIIKGQMYNELTLKSYLTGLKEPLGSHIRAQRPSTIEEALSFVMSEENILYVRNNQNNSNLRTSNFNPNFHNISNNNNFKHNIPQNNLNRNNFRQTNNFNRHVQRAHPYYNNLNRNNNFQPRNNNNNFQQRFNNNLQPRFNNTFQARPNSYNNNNNNNHRQFTSNRNFSSNNQTSFPQPMEVDSSGLFSNRQNLNHITQASNSQASNLQASHTEQNVNFQELPQMYHPT